MPARPQTAAALDFDVLEAITEAVESGLGLPDVVRAAARALDASLVLLDRAGAVLAVAARSSSDEKALMGEASGVLSNELRVGDESVGRLRLRGRSGEPSPALLRVVMTLLASEVERLRAPDRASEAAQHAFLRAVLERKVTDRDNLIARSSELGIDLSRGGAVIVVRAHHFVPSEGDWRLRVLAAADRAARTTASRGALAAVVDTPTEPGSQVVVVVAEGDEAVVQRIADGIGRELHSTMHGFTFAVGHSRVALDPVDLYRAGNEALLAANVAEAGTQDEPITVLAFEATGAYRLLLLAMSEDPAELQRFYSETVAPLVAYDSQYETDLVLTLETFLNADANVAGTAQRLFTHRHTVRYRLERVRELSGLDVGSTDGREKLGLGLKAMHVLGIAAPQGPAREAGAEGGRVPRDTKERL
ncbi:MAG: helix-turn-helix domain-containing protein [Solirubrobacterales bacterium]|jgi:sugar diacid utilization regulator|nr:helix-turn-helix domain-containing protein [Solirubrobacterales bacterium]